MLASEIITKARYTLSDEQGLRWSDARLLSLLNDAMLDTAMTTTIYNKVGFIELQTLQSTYDISSYCIKILRIEFQDKPLKMQTFQEMDELYKTGWQIKTADKPTTIVYDLKSEGVFVLYPKFNGEYKTLFTSNSPYGIITSFSYSDSDIEVVENIEDLQLNDIDKLLKLYYIVAPKTVTALTEELEKVVDIGMISSLVHYICGMALRDNMATEDRQMGNEELMLYENKKFDFVKAKMSEHVKKVRTTTYNSEI